jgi:transposase InsO family protein
MKIELSGGRPGKSTDNGWIERFWKLFRIYFERRFHTWTLSISEIQELLKRFNYWWNYERPNSKTMDLPPAIYRMYVFGKENQIIYNLFSGVI